MNTTISRFAILNQFYQRIYSQKNLQETIWAYIAKGISSILGGIFLLLVPSLLGKISFGNFQYYISLRFFFGQFISWGIEPGSKKYIAANLHRPDDLAKVFKNVFLIKILLALAGGIVTFFITLIFFDFFNIDFASPFYFSLLLAVGVVISNFRELMICFFESIHQLKLQAINDFVYWSLYLVAAGCFYLSGFFNELSIIIAYIIVNTIAFAVGLACLFSSLQLRLMPRRIPIDWGYIRELFAYSLPLFFASSSIVLMNHIDIFVLKKYNLVEQLGNYGLAKEIAMRLIIISAPIITGIVSCFGQSISLQEKRQLLWQRMKALAIINFALMLAIFVGAAPILHFIYGQEFQGAVELLQILVISLFFVVFSRFFLEFFTYIGENKIVFKLFTLAVVINISGNLLVVERYHAAGVSWVTVISWLTFALLSLWYILTKIFIREPDSEASNQAASC